jgi:hypothetical protein
MTMFFSVFHDELLSFGREDMGRVVRVGTARTHAAKRRPIDIAVMMNVVACSRKMRPVILCARVVPTPLNN